MGIAASQARLLMLTARSDDLEFQSEQLAEQRMVIANNVQTLLNEEQQQSSGSGSYQQYGMGDMMGQMGGYMSQQCSNMMGQAGQLFQSMFGFNPFQSSGNNNIENQLEQLQEQDKKLEIQLKQVDTQHQAVQTEEQSIQKQLDKNIQSSFKLFE